MSEKNQEHQQPAEPNHGPWDPAERPGDADAADINEQGQVESAERLRPTPSIWVGSLSDYNNGVLHGEWLDAAREEDDIQADIAAMLARSPTTARTGEPAEEWGIFDYEGFNQLRIDQHEELELVSQIARGVAEHGLAYAAYAEVMDGDRDAMAGFEDAYLGHYDSVEAYAEQLVDDLGYQQAVDQALPESMRPYARIDTAALAHDLQISGDIYVLPADDGGVWLFDAR